MEAPFLNLRSVAYNNANITVLDASQWVTIMDEGLNKISDIAIDSDFSTNTKRTIEFLGKHIVVAEGANGTGVYNASTGAFVEYVPMKK